MSTLSQKQTFRSAITCPLYPKADVRSANTDVRFGPKADVVTEKLIFAISEPQEKEGLSDRGRYQFVVSIPRAVEDKSLPQADLDALAREAHEKICPYSHATRGNVDVQIDVKGV
jgi:hypothetical protein